MSNKTPSSLLPPELLDELFKHTPTDPEGMAAYSHLEALSLLGRAANRQMKVYEGTHKPFSASRGKGFGKGAN